MAAANSEHFTSVAPSIRRGEVVGHDFVGDGGLERLDDVRRRVVPTDVLEHQHARQEHGARVHLVLAGVLRRRAVRRLEDPVAADVVDVGPGRDADPTDLGGQGVGDVVAVEVRGGDDVEVRRTGQHLLQRDVGDGVLDEELVPRLAVAVVPADGDVGELLAHEVVAPLAEGALGELLDVPLVHHRHGLALVVQRVLNGGPDEALGPHGRDRLDADARELSDGPAHLLAQVLGQLLGLGGTGLHLVPGVDVLGVLTEDDHVDQLGVHHRRRHAGEPAHRAQAHVEVEDLAQCHVERADAAADRRGQRALDPDEVRSEGVDRLVGEPVPCLVERLLAGQHLLPGDFVAVLGCGGIEDELGGGPDVDPRSVAFDEGNDGLVGDLECAVVAHADEICHGPDATGRGGTVPIDLVASPRSPPVPFTSLGTLNEVSPPPRPTASRSGGRTARTPGRECRPPSRGCGRRPPRFPSAPSPLCPASPWGGRRPPCR